MTGAAVDPKAGATASDGTRRDRRTDEGKKVLFGEAGKDKRALSDKEKRWRMPSRYQISEKLGQGSYGCVCEALDTEKNRRVAIKRTDHLFDDAMDARRTLREVAILSLLRHDNVVRLLDVFAPGDGHSDFNELYVVMELCDSDLRKLCRSATCLSPLHLRRMLWTLLCGLKYVHSAGVYHRDLKPANCLVNQGCDVKICDFGLARAVGGEGSGREEVNLFARQQRPRSLTGHVVTRWYRAPELILLQEQYTELIDMWSVGCIYAELLGMYEGIDPKDRGPLFKGTACFPLSPHGNEQEMAAPAAGAYRHAKEDQLEMIFDVIGTPTDAEVDMMDDVEAKKYLKSFTSRKGEGFKRRIPQADSEDRDVLEQLVCFNPEERPSAQQLLDHNIFAEVREPHKEVKAKSVATLSFKEEADISKHRLKEYIVREMRKYRAAAGSTTEAGRAGSGCCGRPSLLTGGRAVNGSKRSSASKGSMPHSASRGSLPPI
jgi:mitogen-activated protein kinase 1/3